MATRAALSPEEAAGQIICPTLFGAQLAGAPYDEAAKLAELESYQWGGYVLFHGAREETSSRVAALQARSPIKLLIAADLEHGAGQQVAGLSRFPSAMAFGAANRPEWAYALGALTASEALSVGINWIFAPVADLATRPWNPIIQLRSFGADPARAASMVEAFIRGVQEHGALATAKHFPGHGDAALDSHARLALIEAELALLESREWLPFQAAIRAKVASVMTAHVAIEALDDSLRPATLSPKILECLREKLGFKGLIVTDAMIMGGVSQAMDPARAAVEAIAAGCDMLLMPKEPIKVHRALIQAIKEGRLSNERLQEAAGRVLAAKARLVGGPGGSGEYPADLAERVAAQALTLAKGQGPIRLADGTLAIAVDDGAAPEQLAAWGAALKAQGLAGGRRVTAKTTPEEWLELEARASGSAGILLGLFCPIRPGKERALLTSALLSPLHALCENRKTLALSFGSPFLVCQFPEAATWILAYGAQPAQIEAALRHLSQGRTLAGRLPVQLPAFLPPAKGPDDWPPSEIPAFA